MILVLVTVVLIAGCWCGRHNSYSTYSTYSCRIFLNIFVFQVLKSRIGWIIETISGKYSDIFKRPWVIVFKSFDFFVVNFDDEENLKKTINQKCFLKEN